MIKERLNKFLSDLVNINLKEDASQIQLRSILKIYTIFGIFAHMALCLILLCDREILCCVIAFIYWSILLILLRIGDFIKVEITEIILISSSLIYCIFNSMALGPLARYDAYFFLLVPVLATFVNKKKLGTIFLAVITILYTCANFAFVYYSQLYYLTNWALLSINLINSIYVFATTYFHTLLCNMYNDVTIEKLKEDKKVLDKDSKVDHLTGLYNRRSMERYLNTLEDQYHITNKPFGLILFDIDLFKRVNDTYGHQAGDRVLAEISRLIVYSLRKSDEVFRYGGEEILAVVTGVQTKEDLIKVANGIREDIESLKIPYEDLDISVTISAGTTLFDGAEIDCVIKRVDEALYQAKNNGRNRVEFL